MSDEFQSILDRSKGGDQAASEELFTRYVERLTRMARARISPQLARRIDPEDVVHSAYRSFFVRLRENQFELDESLDLWKLLVKIVQHKLARASRHHRAQRRSYKREQGLSDLVSLSRNEPDVDEVVIFNEQVALLLGHFTGQTRHIIELKLQGYLHQEIADQLGCSEKTVRRALVRVREWFKSDRAETGADSNSKAEQPEPSETDPDFVSDSDYLIQQFVGQGGYGRVYRALDRRTGETVAVKFLKKRFLNDREVISLFLKEAEAAAEFDTPGIVPFLASGRTSHGQLFLVMKFIEGQHLGEWSELNPNRWPEIRSIISKAAAVLECVHLQGILHLDIKPPNLLIDLEGQVWLTDFGMAQFRDAAPDRLRGTLPHLAPEQIEPAFGPVSRRTDYYGLGTVLFQLLTGRDLIQSDTVGECFAQVLRERTDREIECRLPPDIPPELSRLCCALLQRDPESRLCSFEEVRLILRDTTND